MSKLVYLHADPSLDVYSVHDEEDAYLDRMKRKRQAEDARWAKMPACKFFTGKTTVSNNGKTETYKCKCCDCEFEARIVDRNRGWARYCSKSCAAFWKTYRKKRKF